MRIAFFADNFFPELSGIVDSILTTGAELKKRGHAVMYIGPRYAPRDYVKVSRHDAIPRRGEEEHIEDMPVVRLPSLPLPFSPTGQGRVALPTGASLRRLREFKPDILHTHSPYGCGLEALRAAKALRVPLVGTNHTMVEEFYPWIPQLARRLDAAYYNRCSLVTVPYAQLLDSMREKGFSRPGFMQPNPVDLPHFQPPTPEQKQQRKREFGFDGPVILYCGRLSPEKRIDQNLESIAQLAPEFPTLRFVATGRGSDEARLRQLAKHLGIERHVIFTGFVPSQTLAGYFQAADIFALMSTSDSQSLALMQAFSSGLPAVAARSRGLPSYVPAECGFLVEPGNIAQQSERLRQLLREPELRERMGNAAVEYVRRFSPERIADDWLLLYEEAIRIQ